MELFDKITEYRSVLGSIDNHARNYEQFREGVAILQDQLKIQEDQADDALKLKVEAEGKAAQLEDHLSKEINAMISMIKKQQQKCDSLEMRGFSNNEDQKELMDEFTKESAMIDELLKVQQFYKIDFDIAKRQRSFIFKPAESQGEEAMPTQ